MRGVTEADFRLCLYFLFCMFLCINVYSHYLFNFCHIFWLGLQVGRRGLWVWLTHWSSKREHHQLVDSYDTLTTSFQLLHDPSFILSCLPAAATIGYCLISLYLCGDNSRLGWHPSSLYAFQRRTFRDCKSDVKDFFTGRIPFLSPNQLCCQSAEGIWFTSATLFVNFTVDVQLVSRFGTTVMKAVKSWHIKMTEEEITAYVQKCFCLLLA